MRPASLEEFFGQEHILASGKPLLRAIEDGLASEDERARVRAQWSW